MMRQVAIVEREEGEAGVRMGGTLALQVEYRCDGAAIAPVLGLVIKNCYGQSVFGINNRIVRGYRFEAPSSAGSSICRLRDLPLMPGTYSIESLPRRCLP